MFYSIFIELCQEKSLKPSRVADQIGINRATITNWKKKNSMPNAQILTKIAEYFNVSIDHLLGNECQTTCLNIAGNRTKKARTQATLSCVELAEKVHCSKEVLQKFESSGKYIKIIPFDRLAWKLDLTSRYLMGGEDSGIYEFERGEPFGTRLKKIRMAAEKSEREVAVALGVPIIEINALENNLLKANAGICEKIISYFGIHPILFRDTMVSLLTSDTLTLSKQDCNLLMDIEQFFIHLNDEEKQKLFQYTKALAQMSKLERENKNN